MSGKWKWVIGGVAVGALVLIYLARNQAPAFDVKNVTVKK
jgi:hypothetical protein